MSMEDTNEYIKEHIGRMDHIILFDDGRVVASGTYDEISKVWGELNEA